MPVSSLVIVGSSILLQVAGGRWLASPWWMPDVMFAGFLLIIMTSDRRALVSALWAMVVVSTVVSVGHPLGTGLAYLAAGGFLVWISSQWDLAQPSLQFAALGAAEGVLLVLCLMGHRTGLAWGLLPLVIVRIGMTVLSWPVLRRLMSKILRAS